MTCVTLRCLLMLNGFVCFTWKRRALIAWSATLPMCVVSIRHTWAIGPSCVASGAAVYCAPLNQSTNSI
jgi:hypothetical protein